MYKFTLKPNFISLSRKMFFLKLSTILRILQDGPKSNKSF